MEITFKRGTSRSFSVGVPASEYVEGSTLAFTAKRELDDDLSDLSAAINKEFTEEDITTQDEQYVYYAIYIAPEDTADLHLDGQGVMMQGEFTLIKPNGQRVSFPDSDYVSVTVLPSVRNS